MVQLFYEDERDAVRAMISASGKTLKECANHLWPHMKPDTAQAKLRSQLNGNDDGEQLKFAEVIELMRYCKSPDALYYVCDETSHARPAAIVRDDKRAELVAVLKDTGIVMRQALEQLNRLDQQ